MCVCYLAYSKAFVNGFTTDSLHPKRYRTEYGTVNNRSRKQIQPQEGVACFRLTQHPSRPSANGGLFFLFSQRKGVLNMILGRQKMG